MKDWRDYSDVLRRTLFVLGNLVLCIAVADAITIPIRTFFAERDSLIADQRKVLSQLNAIADQEGHVRSIESNTEIQTQRGEFLVGPNEGIINADLQTRLKGIASSAGAQSRAVQSLPPRTKHNISYTGSRIEIYGPLQSIHRAIFAIETATPYLFITNAAIRVMPSNGRLEASREPAIEAQLDVFSAVQIKGRGP